MIAQWCQPTVNITENDISDQFDRLAEETKCSCPDTIRNLYTKREYTHTHTPYRYQLYIKLIAVLMIGTQIISFK